MRLPSKAIEKKILILEDELRELRKSLEYQTMYEEVEQMNKRMTLGDLELFSEVLRAWIEDQHGENV